MDLTIDFETCGLTANAAPMQVAVVPWRRDADVNPFIPDDTEDGGLPDEFVRYVDLRTCVVGGFDFDPDTVRWWAGRSPAARETVCRGLAEPVGEVTLELMEYIRGIAERCRPGSLRLWCQGPDMDIAVLRNLCRRAGADLEDVVPHTSFRDCRTVILEAAMAEAQRGAGTAACGIALPFQILDNPSLAYGVFDPLPDSIAGGEAHDALFDAVRSSWYTWQALKRTCR